MTIQAALAALEEATAAMAREAGTARLERLAPWMARREAAAGAVAAWLAAGGVAPADVERAAACWRQGEEIRERLQVAGAAARQELRSLYQAGWQARALAGQAGVSGSVVDIEG